MEQKGKESYEIFINKLTECLFSVCESQMQDTTFNILGDEIPAYYIVIDGHNGKPIDDIADYHRFMCQFCADFGFRKSELSIEVLDLTIEEDKTNKLIFKFL